jgi:hypothetical protein
MVVDAAHVWLCCRSDDVCEETTKSIMTLSVRSRRRKSSRYREYAFAYANTCLVDKLKMELYAKTPHQHDESKVTRIIDLIDRCLFVHIIR